MLSILNEKGAITEGIFRISGNMSACHALKERLDYGKKVNLKKECVLAVASVLKVWRVLGSSTFRSPRCLGRTSLPHAFPGIKN
jgi:hypothetical protein